MSTSRLDRGVANERTALAWERTALAVVCGAAVVTRLTHDRLGVVALACLAASLPLGAMLLAAGRGRYVRGDSSPSRVRDGRAPAAVTVATLALALVEGAALLR